ncbi:signal peptidase II [Neptunomonas japonica JAMM 1380]|uniref:Lipoprotein signal peptidase n=1 Tax=Neptunomonas japonica JAMM 1380 TaxID=1441457 RepID=A0A7R6SXA4_9GAMM|nr:signal peptidase II [Neptunomonas japonica]BBB31306.1 signal peptidase II [Neptunomonas japonica JAMM 1380]
MTESQKGISLGSLKWLWLTVFVLAADLLSKNFAQEWLDYGVPVALFSGLDMTLLYNRGAAFSFLSEASGWQRWLFVVIAVVISVVLVVWLKRTETRQWWLGMGLALILGGALGNLHDRILLGYVVDFISVYYQSYFFPAFNLADSAITLGAAIMIIDMIFLEKQNEDAESSTT